MAGILTFDEMAAELRISPSTLWRIIAKTPGLTYLKVGRARMFRPADAERLIAALAVSTAAPYTVTRTTRVITAREMNRSGGTAHEALDALRRETKERKAKRAELRKTLNNGWGGRLPTT